MPNPRLTKKNRLPLSAKRRKNRGLYLRRWREDKARKNYISFEGHNECQPDVHHSTPKEGESSLCVDTPNEDTMDNTTCRPKKNIWVTGFTCLASLTKSAKIHEQSEFHAGNVNQLAEFERERLNCTWDEADNQESKHEVFIKSEAEEILDIYDDNTVGNFPPSIIERPDISDPASASQSLPSNKKRKFTHSPLPSSSTDIGDNTVQNIDTSKVETEFDLWARSVAHQLNHMELKRALRLQLKMQTLLSEERINQDCDSVTSVKPPSSTDGSTSNPSEGAS